MNSDDVIREPQSQIITGVSTTLEGLIRNHILELPEGTMFGSEETLLERYGVSRPTLRETLRVMSSEQLLEVRRGVGGGYFVRRPDAALVTRIASTYLSGRNSTLEHTITASLPVRRLIARLACRCEDEDLRAELRRLIDEDCATATHNQSEFGRTERAFLALLGQMSGNPVLEMVQQVIVSLAEDRYGASGLYRHLDERINAMRQARAELHEAIFARNEQLANVHSRRCALFIQQWMIEDGYNIVDLSD